MSGFNVARFTPVARVYTQPLGEKHSGCRPSRFLKPGRPSWQQCRTRPKNAFILRFVPARDRPNYRYRLARYG